MLGYMNSEALEKTITDQRVTFYSRSKQRLWTKGETSGNFLELKDWQYDCDADALLLLVAPEGPVCHTGEKSCFHQKEFRSGVGFLAQLQSLIAERKSELPEGSYTTSLFEKGIDRIAQKVGEEAIETVIAAKNSDDSELIYEASDLIYHLLVLLTQRSLSIDDLTAELKKRHQ